MLFILKKFIGSLLLPLPLLLLTMATGLILIWFSRWQRSGKTVLSISWLLLLLVSLQPVADFWLRSIENRYPTYRGTETFNYIVVLGGGYTYNPAWAPSSNTLNNSLPRITEGIRLYLNHPGSKLIFTGTAARGNPVSSAEVSARVALSLGVINQDIILLTTPRDTEEEAIAVEKIVGQQSFLLVTSASHLPRAVTIFQRQGLKPTPAAANQLAIHSPLNFWEKISPSAQYLMHSERAWYETLGRLWISLKTIFDKKTDGK